MIAWAREEQLPQIRALWQEAFGDPAAYLDLFFHACFDSRRVLTLYEDGRLAAMATVFRAALGTKKIWYLYAVATDAACRGRGFATTLMERAAGLAAEEGAAGLLVLPGSDSLRDFYAARGYCAWGSRAAQWVAADPSAAAVPLRQLPAEQYGALREQLLRGEHIRFGTDFLQVQRDAAELAGGGLYGLTVAGLRCCAVVLRTRDALEIPELLAPQPVWPAAVQAILRQFEAPRAHVAGPGGQIPYGMLRQLEKLPPQGYLGLALD